MQKPQRRRRWGPSGTPLARVLGSARLILSWARKGLVNRRFARPFYFRFILLADVRISRPGSSLSMHLLSFNSFFPILINLPKGPFNIHDIPLKRIFFLFALFTNTTLPITADCQENPAIVAGKDIVVVPTAYGKVRGYIHNGVYAFKGIPYATARRFIPPENPASWKDVRSSMTYGPTCPSPELQRIARLACLHFHQWSDYDT